MIGRYWLQTTEDVSLRSLVVLVRERDTRRVIGDYLVVSCCFGGLKRCNSGALGPVTGASWEDECAKRVAERSQPPLNLPDAAAANWDGLII